ncbi:hypothetical protein [Glycomyces buryatensis]|uniref:Uncharacterized protein n=1 Tax=Glycomyces buryatensis TaxID=2570927 RepID=A0A4S8PVG1_9ACTN|nr:hypothetical protein [Glycomyces buryatensis]THV33935.1 hypothetical protein FAB82_24480 [Glycomyces buryatensis]
MVSLSVPSHLPCGPDRNSPASSPEPDHGFGKLREDAWHHFLQDSQPLHQAHYEQRLSVRERIDLALKSFLGTVVALINRPVKTRKHRPATGRAPVYRGSHRINAPIRGTASAPTRFIDRAPIPATPPKPAPTPPLPTGPYTGNGWNPGAAGLITPDRQPALQFTTPPPSRRTRPSPTRSYIAAWEHAFDSNLGLNLAGVGVS